ncbi:unnamed protein product [Schistosoma turkestanicum]|nr:unnamed protein product [Schistosoma turkestanicum]
MVVARQHIIPFGIYISKKLRLVIIFILLIFQISSIILYYNYITDNSLQAGFLNDKSVVFHHMNMLNKCTKSEQIWLQCVNQLNNLNIISYKRLSGFDSSVRLFYTPLNDILLDIQFPFKINNKHRINGTLNEHYVLSNTSTVIQMPNNNSSVKTQIKKVHHPKYFDVNKALHAIEDGLPNNSMPINGGPIFVVQLPMNVCNPNKPPENLELIVIVKSCAYCFDNRWYARNTYMKSHLWMNFRIRFVFVVGLPMPNETDIFHFDGFDVDLQRNASELSSLYNSSRWIAAKNLYDESRQFNDMLVGSFYDTYFNLTSKMILSFRWAATFCKKQTPLWLFLDDDFVLLPVKTIHFIRSLNYSGSKSIAIGMVHRTRVVVRPSRGKSHLKWAVSVKEYPWDYYPPYFYGTGYLLSSDVVSDASLAMAFTQNIRIDDSFLGIVLGRLNKTLIDMKEFDIEASDEEMESSVIIIDMDSAEEIVDWVKGEIRNSY